jgi:chromosome segregation ATPase
VTKRDLATNGEAPQWRSGVEMFDRTNAVIDAARRSGWASGHSRHRNLSNQAAAMEPIRAALVARWRELDDAIAAIQVERDAAAARADALEAENAALRHRIALIREEAERLIELGREHPANAGGYATNILWHCRRVVLTPGEGDGNAR